MKADELNDWMAENVMKWHRHDNVPDQNQMWNGWNRTFEYQILRTSWWANGDGHLMMRCASWDPTSRIEQAVQCADQAIGNQQILGYQQGHDGQGPFASFRISERAWSILPGIPSFELCAGIYRMVTGQTVILEPAAG